MGLAQARPNYVCVMYVCVYMQAVLQECLYSYIVTYVTVRRTIHTQIHTYIRYVLLTTTTLLMNVQYLIVSQVNGVLQHEPVAWG